MISAFRATLSRRFTTVPVNQESTGEETFYFFRQDPEANQLLLKKLKATVDERVEDLGLTNELDRLQLDEIMRKHNVKVPQVVLNEIMSWSR
jgi:hypothetical protein